MTVECEVRLRANVSEPRRAQQVRVGGFEVQRHRRRTHRHWRSRGLSTSIYTHIYILSYTTSGAEDE